jgi:hypothetical protein
VSRRALEAIALEGYREHSLTLYQISEMLDLSRVETEDFLGQHHIPLADRRRRTGPRGSAVRSSVSPQPALTYTRDEGRSEGRDCSMAKNFRELEAKMSPEGRARSDAKTQKMIEEGPGLS